MLSSPHPADLAPGRVPADVDWRHYVPSLTAPDVRPVAVHAHDGEVAGIADLVGGAGPLTLTYREGDTAPSVVLDYGRNIAGIPWLNVSDVDGAPNLLLSYSESAAWTGVDGDLEGSHNDTGNHDRTETFEVEAPGTLSSGLVQGGQRYQRITLTTPGTLVIGDVGMRFAAYRATAEDYQGWFVCSDDLLNRIWFDGAYTVQINQLPACTLPVPWSVREGSLLARGGNVAVLTDGQDWADVDVTFQTQLIDQRAGWIVRASDEGRTGYLFVLHAADGPDRPARLDQFAVDDGHEDRPQDNTRRYTPLGSVRLTEALLDPTDGDWHTVRTTAQGHRITVEIDGAVVSTLDATHLPAGVPQRASGSVGFHQAWGFKTPVEQAGFRNLVVTASDGTTLFEDTLDEAAALDAFSGDAVRHPDPLPVILDGGKRDRTVWSGDLLVQIPNVFYTTAAEEYVRGSIELLNGYQEPTGQSAARVPPVLPPATWPQHGQTYSAVYSMHQLVNLALHHLYTGETTLAAEQSDWTHRMLAWCRTLLDERGLVVTDDVNGLDWDWYDGPKTGAVTAYNAAYHQMLHAAATLADAVDQPAEAIDLRRQADALRSAINTHLYDPRRHLYRLSDARPDAIALDGNCLAVLAGLPPEGEATAVLDALEEALPQTPFGPSPFSVDTGFWPQVSPYVGDMHLRALFSAGETARALNLMRRLWGHMATDEQHAVGTAWELVGTDGAPGFGAKTSLAHGWAAGATTALSASVLGVTPTSPGYATWSIAPQPGDLAWARGRVPTPRGPIDVSWTVVDGRLDLEITVPEGTTGTVTLPPAAPDAAAQVVPISAGGSHHLSVG
ncbi:alpha-L-rhamnosidase C-terminal domain-containing protein [Promicromonospora sp. Marseille-Q5078]